MKKIFNFVFAACLFGMVACSSADNAKEQTSEAPAQEEAAATTIEHECDECCDECEATEQAVSNSIENIGHSTTVSSAGTDRTFVKTNYKCNKCWSTGTRGCTGYWGYKHSNGTYEGNCQNSDGWGHRCNHSPEKHGLRSW